MMFMNSIIRQLSRFHEFPKKGNKKAPKSDDQGAIRYSAGESNSDCKIENLEY